MNDHHAIVLYDGDCAYCNSWVRWISQRDRNKVFRFVSLASEGGRSLRERFQVPAEIESIVLIEAGRAWLRSDAAWRILRALPGQRLAAWLLRIVPRSLRDGGYELIARNRHRLGGTAMPPL